MSQDKSKQKQAEPLSIPEKVGYGLGDTASNFYWKLFENFQLFFYTEVFGLKASAAGTMFLVTKLWDAVNDPMVGYLADRTRTAWGRFRPYLLWMSLPFAITGVMTFYTPDLSYQGKLIYAYITYTLVFMAYTAINIPYGALMGVISPSSLERTSVSTYRFVLAFFGGLIVQLATEPMVRFFGKTFGNSTAAEDGTEIVDQQTGFVWTVGVYAICAMLLFLITFATTKERVEPIKKENNRFTDDVKDLLGNRPWLVLVFVGMFQILSDWTRGTATGYYFKYYVEQDFGQFLAAGTVAAILGMLTTRYLVSIFGKKWLLILMNLAKAVLTAAFFLLDSSQVTLMYGIHILSAFVTGPIPIVLWAMYADVADYSEWKTGRRATGLIFAAATFSQKLGSAVGSAVPGWALGYYGFKEPIDNQIQQQSPETISGIINMMSLMPAGFLFFAIVALLVYNLDQSMVQQIESDLEQRKAEAVKADQIAKAEQADSKPLEQGE